MADTRSVVSAGEGGAWFRGVVERRVPAWARERGPDEVARIRALIAFALFGLPVWVAYALYLVLLANHTGGAIGVLPCSSPRTGIVGWTCGCTAAARSTRCSPPGKLDQTLRQVLDRDRSATG